MLLTPLATTSAEPGDWNFGGAIVYTVDDRDHRLDGVVGGSRISSGGRLTDAFSLEGRFGYSQTGRWPKWPTITEKETQEFLDIGLDLLSNLNPDGSFSSCLLVGAGCLGTSTSSGSEENRPSASAGLGFKWRLGRSAF